MPPKLNERSDRPTERPIHLWQRRQREVIAIAAFVTGLKIVAVHGYDSAIGEIGERAGDRRGRSVIDDDKDSSGRESNSATTDGVETRSRINGRARRANLIGLDGTGFKVPVITSVLAKA